jgi:hypothetical protein
VVRALLLLALAGCEWLADIPRPSQIGADAGDDAMVGECMESVQCPTDRPACVDQVCRLCDDDDQCPSGVCSLDGTCADPARILFASDVGAGDCLTAATACSFDTAVGMISPAKDIIKLAPANYPRAAMLTLAVPVHLAGKGATMTGPGGVVPLLDVPAGGDVKVTGLVMELNGGYAGQCSAGGAMRFHRTRIANGFIATFGQMCHTELVRTQADSLSAYGVYVNGGTARIENTILSRVGNASSQLAALVLLAQPTVMIDHVTIANSINDGTVASAVQCQASPVTLTSMIIRNNTGLAIDPTCVVTHSVVDPGYTGTGMPVHDLDPRFVDPAIGDFHLMPGSPAFGLGDPASTLATDIDGDSRGSPSEPGADELP